MADALHTDDRWKSALEAAGAGAWELDLENDRGWCSARHAEIFGYHGEQTEWTRESFLGHVLKEDRPAVDRAVRNAVAQRTEWSFECRIRRSDGEVRWVAVQARVAYVGETPVRAWGVLHDVTERKAAEVALRKSEQSLRLVSDHMPAMIAYVDRNMIYRFNNRRYEEWFGMSADEVTGKHVRAALGEAQFRHRLPYLERALAGEEVRFEAPTRHCRLGERQTDVNYVPDIDEDGAVRGVFVMVTDITDRKDAEEALKDASRRKDEFLATLSHELRNPLAAILSALEVRRLTSGEGGAADPMQEILERQVEQMVRLVDDLLDVSRITRGKIELRKERVDLARATRWAVDECEPLIVSAAHDLTLETPGEPLVVDADPVRLVQVISNLLTNAAKFTKRGGRIRLSIRREDGAGIIAVRDNGIGIEPKLLPRVFEMFTQGNGFAGVRSGLGIGLTLVQSLVEMHGGSVEARSDGKDRGSEFLVRLPLALEAGLRGDARRSRIESPAERIEARVLVVDDNRDAADSLAMLLKRLDVHADVVYGGAEALAALDAVRPDVMLLDLGMPGVDGYEVARQVRLKSEHRHVHLVALTGWGGDRDLRRTRAAGFDRHVVKPVGVNALQELLTSL